MILFSTATIEAIRRRFGLSEVELAAMARMTRREPCGKCGETCLVVERNLDDVLLQYPGHEVTIVCDQCSQKMPHNEKIDVPNRAEELLPGVLREIERMN